jgi:hypothetical protein
MTPEPRRGYDEDETAPWEWSEPSPLISYANLPTFPDKLLPGRLGSYARALSRSTQTPVDLAAMMVLAGLSTAAGGRVVVEVRRDWAEPVNLYLVSVAASGERKSAVVAAVTAPFWSFEKRKAVESNAERAEQLALKMVAQKARDKAVNTLATAKPDDQEAARSALRAATDGLESIEVPPALRLLADDATPEALVSLMADQRGRIAVLSPEGGDVFDLIGGRYGKEPNLGIYLKAHAGEPYRTDRKGRAPEFIERPALTLGLAVQPEVVTSIARMPGFRGRGLLARLLYSIPVSIVGSRSSAAAPIDDVLIADYTNMVTGLLETIGRWDDVMRLGLVADALDVVIGYLDTVEARLAPDGAYGVMRDWGSKLVGAAVRIAGLLHVAEAADLAHRTPITAETMRAGVDIAEYFSAHAFAAFGLMGADPALDDAQALLRWIERSELVRFTKRDAFVAHQSRFVRVDRVEAPLDLLESTGWIRLVPAAAGSPLGGRPPSPVYEVNPLMQNLHNMHNLG